MARVAPGAPLTMDPAGDHCVGSMVPESSRVGRDNQRFAISGERLVAGCDLHLVDLQPVVTVGQSWHAVSARIPTVLDWHLDWLHVH